MFSLAGAAKDHVALSVFVPGAVASPSAATSAPPSAHVFRAYESNALPGATEPLHPSAGAGWPEGVRQPYTWYCPASAVAGPAASAPAVSARRAIRAACILRETISILCRSLGASCPPCEILSRRASRGRRRLSV